MITKELLQTFCSEDETRPNIMHPFNFAEHTIATDGRILVAVPKMDGFQEADGKLTSLPSTLKLYPKEAVTWFPLPIIPERKECDRCCGTGHQECPECFSEIDCRTCQGFGDVYEVETVAIGKRIFNPRYLEKLSQLPDVSIASEHNDDPDEHGFHQPLAFRFTVGFGLLMPMRK